MICNIKKHIIIYALLLLPALCVANSLQYKIINIDTIGKNYIIHASRNDSTFKIVSTHKYKVNLKRFNKIEINKSYYLKLHVEFPFTWMGHIFTDLSNGHHIYHKGKTITIKPDSKSHGKIYGCKNLNGLYYIK